MAGVRVLVFSDLWPPFPGGAERLVFNVARQLERRGNDVSVVTGYEHALPFDGPQVLAVDNLDVGRLVSLLEPDVVLTHHHWAYKYEDDFYALDVPVVQLVLNTRRLECAALAGYISRWVRQQCGDDVIGDMLLRPPVFADDVVAATHAPAIGFVKPLPHKGVDLVYRIAERMPEERFVVLRGEWQTLEDIRPAANVTFVEPVEDMREFWSMVDIAIVPSLSEDAGTVAQEATANGLPCCSTEAGGLAETNAGGVFLSSSMTGRWVSALRLLRRNAQHRQRVVARQRRHLEQRAGELDAFCDAIEALA